jgi:hypothetical protein
LPSNIAGIPVQKRWWRRYLKHRRPAAAASAKGRGFMSYGRARARLRQAIAGVTAAGGMISPALVVQVFE